jgi:uncharacterized protein (DUF2147 family)
MKTDVLWLSFLALTVGISILAFLYYKLKLAGSDFDLTGIWFSESLNVRILIHSIDSVFQGSVVWANGMDQLLGTRVVENLRFNKSNVGFGKYSDPFTGKKYEIKMNLSRKGKLMVKAFYPQTQNLAFSQEWNQVLQ